MSDVSLTLLGLRRIGVSMGLALRRYEKSGRASHHFVITGYDKEASAGKEAQRLGAIDAYERRLDAACANADLIIVDATLSQLREYLEAIGPALKAGCVIVEMTRLKQPPIQWAERYLPESAYLVGLAPVLNPSALFTVAADNDLSAASADLFDHGNLFIAASPTCPAEAVQLASDLVRLLGLEPHYLEPAEHDGLVAAIGLLPALMGVAELNVAVSAPSWKDMRRLTNPAFALVTTALLGDPTDLVDALTLDRSNVTHYLDRALQQLQALRATLAQGDDATLRSALAEASTQYLKWLSQRESDNWQDRPSMQVPTVRSGILHSLLGGLAPGSRKDEDKD